MTFQAETQAKNVLLNCPQFSEIEKEADDDDGGPPGLEVRTGKVKRGSPRKTPKKSPRKRKAPGLVKAPIVFATDEEPSTSTGECQLHCVKT